MTSDETEWLEFDAGRARIAVSTDHPVAVIRSLGAEDVVVSWSDLPVGVRAVSASVVGSPTGAWVFYCPEESEDSALPHGSPAAVHVAADGSLTRFAGLEARHALGATRHGLWLTARIHPAPDDRSAWREPQPVTVLQPCGRARVITVEGVIAFALDHGGSARAVVHDGAPETNDGAAGGHGGLVYRYLAIPIGDELPDEIRTRGNDVESLTDEELFTAMEAAAPRVPDASPAQAPVPWAIVPLNDSEKDAALTSVLREFEHLDAYWHGADGSVGPLVRGLADPLVEVNGHWPHTRVDVTFTHPHYREGRLRRSIRVYDDAGRIRPATYASIHLMEDLETMAPPAADQAENCVVDI